MRIGVNRWCMPAEWSLEKAVAEAARAGFQGIELNLAEEGPLTPDSSRADVERVAARVRAAGLELTSLSSGLGWRHPLTSGDPAVRARAREILARSLHVARWLGVDPVLCVPGVVEAETRYDTAWDRALEAVRDAAPLAAEVGVALCVENVWNRFLLSPLEMARFIDEAGSPWVQAYFDVGNVLLFGFPQHWIEILGTRIRRVHVKDFKTAIGSIRGFANPLQGDVPWRAVRDSLASIGYDGWITAEVEGYRHLPELGLRHLAESLRAVFGE